MRTLFLPNGGPELQASLNHAAMERILHDHNCGPAGMFYTDLSLMFSRNALSYLIFFILAVAPAVFGVQKSYVTGKFIDVQQKTRDKVTMYLVNTPVTTPVPYFEISLELGGTRYVAEYSPRHSEEELPEAWRAGEDVQARVEKRHLFLKRSDGSEMEWLIVKHSPVSDQKKTP